MDNPDRRRPRYGHFICLWLVCLISGPLFAQQGQWQEHYLSNGLAVRYIQDTTRTLLHIGLTMRGGGSWDGSGAKGLAHLYEHLFFQYLPDSTSADEGSDQGILISHRTQLESHFFGISVDPKLRDGCLRMIANGLAATDWSDSALTIARSAVASVLQAWEGAPENNLRAEVQDELWKTTADKKHLVGRYADILRLTSDRILQSTAAYRHPGNCLLAGTGRQAPADFFAGAEAALGNWQPESAGAVLPSFGMPRLDTSFYFTSLNEFATTPLIMMAWPVPIGPVPGETTRDAEYFCTLAGMRQGEMYRRLVDGGLASGFNWTWAGGSNPGQILLSVFPERDSIKACLQAITDAMVVLATERKGEKQLLDATDRQMRLQAARRNDQGIARLMAMGQAWLLAPDTSAVPTPMTGQLMRDFCQRYILKRPHVAGLMLSSNLMATLPTKKDFRPTTPTKPVVVAVAPVAKVDSPVVAAPHPVAVVDTAAVVKEAYRCGDPAVLRSYRLYFDTDGTTPQAKGISLLEDLAAMLKAHPDKRVYLNSFSEGLGDGVKNYQLSVSRAKSTRAMLVERFGIPPQQVVIRAYGEAFPEVPDENDLRNRRIGFDFAPQDAQDNAF